MKKNLNVTPLSRAQMKMIVAGEGFCPVGDYISQCYCDNGMGPYCIPADGNTPAHACSVWCLNHYDVGGTANGNTCVTSCPGI